MVEDEVAEIAHDLRSPLGAIALEATLLDEQLDVGNIVDPGGAVTRIQRNVAFLDRLVLDLLDVCAAARGELILARAPTELCALLGRVISRVSGSARGRVFLDATDPVVANVDDHRIERVVSNLLDNAIKYTPEPGAIVVGLTCDGHEVRISVSDSGQGIDGVDVPHVFERYRRAGTARGTRGNGIGLYACKKIVEAHGGEIGVASIRGVGSRFFFSLPT